jgi:hypothetical protein
MMEGGLNQVDPNEDSPGGQMDYDEIDYKICGELGTPPSFTFQRRKTRHWMTLWPVSLQKA